MAPFKEAWSKRLIFPSDPSAARELLEQIKTLWKVEPLKPLLRVCEHERAEAEEVAQVAGVDLA